MIDILNIIFIILFPLLSGILNLISVHFFNNIYICCAHIPYYISYPTAHMSTHTDTIYNAIVPPLIMLQILYIFNYKIKTLILYFLHTLFQYPYSYDTLLQQMLGSKAPNYDTYELFRATHSHNSTQYSHIVGLSSHFYAHIGAGPKVIHPPMSKLMWVQTF